MQQDLVRMIPGLEEARVIRPGYAIEYDFVDPRELGPDLQRLDCPDSFMRARSMGRRVMRKPPARDCSQGINAALYTQKRESLRLRRKSRISASSLRN
jgi:tRNA uridine 5-carboxymethylaminomethyl modification enzyme